MCTITEFVKRFLLFVSLGLLILVVLSVPHKILLDRSLRICQFPQNYGIVILGDSHTQTSLDPGIIKNAVNISNSMEPYFYSYYKLRYVLNHVKIQRVILGFSHHNLSTWFEPFVFHPEQIRREMFTRYFILLDDEGIYRIMSPTIPFISNYLEYKFGFSFKQDYRFLFNALSGKIQPSDFPFWGTFYRTDITLFKEEFRLNKQSLKNLRQEGVPRKITDALKSMKLRIFDREDEFLTVVEEHIGKEQTLKYQKQILKHGRYNNKDARIHSQIKAHYYTTNDKLRHFLEIQLEYLERIIVLCQDNNVAIYLFNAPVHREYKKKIPHEFVEKYVNLSKNFSKKYSNVTLLDWSNLVLPLYCYRDADHLNQKGAKLVSKKINTMFNKLSPRQAQAEQRKDNLTK